jgi:hypothetical protein
VVSPQIAVAARAEYLADIGGLYSGITQYLKDGTLALDYRAADGILMRGEFGAINRINPTSSVTCAENYRPHNPPLA